LRSKGLVRSRIAKAPPKIIGLVALRLAFRRMSFLQY
jgi:hypothetical protein